VAGWDCGSHGTLWARKRSDQPSSPSPALLACPSRSPPGLRAVRDAEGAGARQVSGCRGGGSWEGALGPLPAIAPCNPCLPCPHQQQASPFPPSPSPPQPIERAAFQRGALAAAHALRGAPARAVGGALTWLLPRLRRQCRVAQSHTRELDPHRAHRTMQAQPSPATILQGADRNGSCGRKTPNRNAETFRKVYLLEYIERNAAKVWRNAHIHWATKAALQQANRARPCHIATVPPLYALS
jgi:hypothetical protein